MGNTATLENGLRVERIDDIPLIIGALQKIGIGDLIDQFIPVHKNWKGLGMGKVAEIWMSYIISEGDHKLNRLEDWAMARILMFEALYEGVEICRTDFTDDKLAIALDYLSKNEYWENIEREINRKIIRVYKIDKSIEGLRAVRLDATIGQGHRQVEEGGLFQFGASKHFNSSLPQFKIMMSTLDSEINGFAYPVASMTVSGNTADDVLYLPILEQTKKSLGSTDPLLIVGDKKLSSAKNRAHIVESSDYYLSPLSAVQVSGSTLKTLIVENKERIKNVLIEGEKVGKGFEYKAEISVSQKDEEPNKLIEWTERRIVFQSVGHAKSQVAAFEKRIENTKKELENVLLRKQGKQTLETEEEVQAEISKLLKASRVESYISVDISKTVEVKKIRGYKGGKSRTEKKEIFELSIKLNEQKIEEDKSYCGWCIYATNAPLKEMKIKDVVSMYRGQYQIESRFNDLKNKVTKLMPVFLQKENRVRGLINFMMIGLKAICAMEITVAKKLKKGNKKLTGIYAGNPKRGTERPTAKMMLSRFKGVSFSMFMEKGKVKYIGLTSLDVVQLNILRLLGFKEDIYSGLVEKMNLKLLG